MGYNYIRDKLAGEEVQIKKSLIEKLWKPCKTLKLSKHTQQKMLNLKYMVDYWKPIKLTQGRSRLQGQQILRSQISLLTSHYYVLCL